MVDAIIGIGIVALLVLWLLGTLSYKLFRWPAFFERFQPKHAAEKEKELASQMEGINPRALLLSSLAGLFLFRLFVFMVLALGVLAFFGEAYGVLRDDAFREVAVVVVVAVALLLTASSMMRRPYDYGIITKLEMLQLQVSALVSAFETVESSLSELESKGSTLELTLSTIDGHVGEIVDSLSDLKEIVQGLENQG